MLLKCSIFHQSIFMKTYFWTIFKTHSFKGLQAGNTSATACLKPPAQQKFNASHFFVQWLLAKSMLIEKVRVKYSKTLFNFEDWPFLLKAWISNRYDRLTLKAKSWNFFQKPVGPSEDFLENFPSLFLSQQPNFFRTDFFQLNFFNP